MKIILTVELAQALLNYLQNRPYMEVHQFITALIQAEKLQADEPESKEQ